MLSNVTYIGGYHNGKYDMQGLGGRGVTDYPGRWKQHRYRATRWSRVYVPEVLGSK
jgi:hypothetical protein